MIKHNVLLFFHHDVVTNQSNPRITSYISYLKKQGHTPCFRFVKSTSHNRVPYWKHYFRLLVSTAYSYAYFYSPNALVIPMYVICKLRGIPVVVEKTELDSIKPHENWKDWVNEFLYKFDELVFPLFASQLVVISTKLKEFYSKKNIKITLVGAFLTESTKAKSLPSHPDSSRFQIGYLGSNAQKDDLKTLFKAFSQLKKEIPHAELNLYGSNFNKSSIGAERGVKVHGFLKHNSIQKTLKANDVLVAIRNKHEYSDYGFPSKLTEYFASKQPIIASKSSDIPQLFRHKEQLYLIDSESPNQLSEALKWCALNKSEACAMGQRGYQWARQNWDSELVLKSWYQACLGHVK